MKRLMLTALMGCMLMQLQATPLEAIAVSVKEARAIQKEARAIQKFNTMLLQATIDGIQGGLFLGAGLPLIAGGIVALGTQAYHMNFQNFTNGQSSPNIFFNGLANTNIRPNPFFAQGKPIPNLGYRFAYWTKIASFCGIGLAALAKIYTIFYPSMNFISPISAHGNFVKDATICGSLLTTAALAHFISEGLKPRIIESTRNDEQNN